MDWYKKIRDWYNLGAWTIEMVQNAVTMEKISSDQMTEILNNPLT